MFPVLIPGSLDSVIDQLKDVRERVLWIRIFNRVLIFMAGIFCIYGAWVVYSLNDPVEADFPVMPIPITDNVDLERRRVRVEIVRNIFEPYITSAELAQKTSINIQELKAKYRVVAVVLDGEPQVIMEDQQSQETFFLKIGDEIDGAFIEIIERDRVTLKLKGQVFEIRA